MTKVLLVDDEPLLLESLEIILTMKGGFEVAGCAANGKEALKILSEKKVDVMLADLNMPEMGGLELISNARAKYPEVKIIVLTTFYDSKNISEAIKGGAVGYLLKDSGKEAVINAVNQAMNGQSVLDTKVMAALSGFMNENSESEKENASLSSLKTDDIEVRMTEKELTESEKKVARLLADGFTNSQIASLLCMSEGTVKNYVSVIYDKCDMHDRTRLAVWLKD